VSDDSRRDGDGEQREEGPTYTAAERAILDEMCESRDDEWVADNAALLLAQARLVGEL
jgi:hypothetical protein